ncbi:hypothetical protein Tco_0503517 [Tanacetum coccineum]
MKPPQPWIKSAEASVDTCTAEMMRMMEMKHCQQFIYSQFSLDYDNQITNKSFSEYTRIKAKDFRDTLLKHMSSFKKSIAEKARYQRQYDRRVNEIQMQIKKREVDRGKAMDADLVVTESSGT